MNISNTKLISVLFAGPFYWVAASADPSSDSHNSYGAISARTQTAQLARFAKERSDIMLARYYGKGGLLRSKAYAIAIAEAHQETTDYKTEPQLAANQILY